MFDGASSPTAVALDGSYAYVCDDDNGLKVVDISNLASPQLVGAVDTPGYARGVAVTGTHVFVADGTSGVRVIDISTPSNPTEVGSIVPADGVQDIEISGNIAAV